MARPSGGRNSRRHGRRASWLPGSYAGSHPSLAGSVGDDHEADLPFVVVVPFVGPVAEPVGDVDVDPLRRERVDDGLEPHLELAEVVVVAGEEGDVEPAEEGGGLGDGCGEDDLAAVGASPRALESVEADRWDVGGHAPERSAVMRRPSVMRPHEPGRTCR
jgi:hypothetical protein